MSKKNSPRKQLQRAIKEKWIPKFEQIQNEAMHFIPDYAEGSDSNMKKAAELEIICQLMQVNIEACKKLLHRL